MKADSATAARDSSLFGPQSARPASELTELRRAAESRAKERQERVTTAHLLLAIAELGGDAGQLLMDRRLTRAVIEKSLRVVQDDEPQALTFAFDRAKELAARHRAPTASGLHLLLALCHDQKTAAHRAMSQCGIDVSKMRLAAMQLASGLVATRKGTPAQVTNSASAQRAEFPALTFAGMNRTADFDKLRASSPQIVAPLASVRVPASTRLTPVTGETTSTPLSRIPQPKSKRPMQVAALAKAPAGRAEVVIAPAQDKAATTPARPHAKSLEVKASPSRKAPAIKCQDSALAAVTLSPKQFPLLTALGRNLSELAALGQLGPALGREHVVDRVLDVLAKRSANVPCLVGPSGVGKSSVVRALALRLREDARLGGAPRIVVELAPAQLLSGMGARAQLGDRLQKLQHEIAKAEGRIIVFFDDLHGFLLADGVDEGASELRRMLAQGAIPCVTATMPEGYRQIVERDPALARNLASVEVPEPNKAEARAVLEAIAPGLCTHHRVQIAPSLFDEAVNWTARYVPERALPDKAIQLLDLACARAHRQGHLALTREVLAQVTSELTSVPEERLLETDGARMLNLEARLALRVVGHAAPLAKISRHIRRNASGLGGRRPIGVFLLLGPTGVGKTEAAKAVAECLFGSPDAMTRLDMSEYAEAHAVARLIGAPPGYVGHEAGGQLTEAVRKRPYQVILLDEIEKAHRDVLETFLQVFDEGRLTDGRGRTWDLTNTVIFLTSNLGAAHFTKVNTTRIGFSGVSSAGAGGFLGHRERADCTDGAEGASLKNSAEIESKVLAAAKAALPPELLNRFDEVLVFAPLARIEVAEVALRMIAALRLRLAEKRLDLDVAKEAVEFLLDHGGYDPEFGARPMRRALSRHLEAPLAELLLSGTTHPGDVILCDVGEGQLELDVVRHDATV